MYTCTILASWTRRERSKSAKHRLHRQTFKPTCPAATQHIIRAGICWPYQTAQTTGSSISSQMPVCAGSAGHEAVPFHLDSSGQLNVFAGISIISRGCKVRCLMKCQAGSRQNKADFSCMHLALLRTASKGTAQYCNLE